MEKIILTGVTYAKTKFQGKSKFSFWTDIIPGDEIEISMELKKTGTNRGKIYAPILIAKNYRTGETFKDSINSIQNYLNKII